MAHAKMIYKGYKFKKEMDKVAKIKERVEKERIDAERAALGLPPLKVWYKDCFIQCFDAIRSYAKVVLPCCIYDRYRKINISSKWCCRRCCIDGTYENQVFKSIFGFFSGAFLAVFILVLMVFQLGYSVRMATVISIGFGVVLTLGLAFSLNMRCVILLMIPGLFSSKGRAFLLVYCFVMVMNGPVQNFHHNLEILSTSTTCSQFMANNQTQELIDEALAPAKGIIGGLRQVLFSLKHMAQQLQRAFMALKAAFAEIFAAIKRAFAWLGNMVNICNDNMGAPYRKCIGAFDTAYNDCRSKLGIVKFLCEVVKVIRPVCNVARVGELLCFITDAIANMIKKDIKGNIKEAIHNIHEMFYFNVTLIYEFEYNVTQSKSNREVQKDIMKEINDRIRPFMRLVTWTNTAILIMVAWLLIKSLIYRKKYLTKDKFDNYYITFNFRDIDERRQEMNREALLPTNKYERGKYIKTMSLRLVKKERQKLILGLVMLLGSILHTCFYLGIDYGIFWLLSMIRKHAELKTHDEVPHHMRMHVQGEGVLADMYRELISAFDPMGKVNLGIDTTPCLPNPSPPDFELYNRVFKVWGLCIFLVITEAYGLRMRHVVMGCYHTTREKQRAVWLYNHMLHCRGGLLKFIRRQLRRRNMCDKYVEKINIRSRLAAQFPMVGKVFKYFGFERKYCLCCSQPGKIEDLENFKHCDNYGCEAVYCQDCFTDINNMCTVCMKPVDYGDFSDYSEERDSSDEENVDIGGAQEDDKLDLEYQGNKSSVAEDDMFEEMAHDIPGPRDMASMEDLVGYDSDSTTDEGESDIEVDDPMEPRILSITGRPVGNVSDGHGKIECQEDIEMSGIQVEPDVVEHGGLPFDGQVLPWEARLPLDDGVKGELDPFHGEFAGVGQQYVSPELDEFGRLQVWPEFMQDHQYTEDPLSYDKNQVERTEVYGEQVQFTQEDCYPGHPPYTEDPSYAYYADGQYLYNDTSCQPVQLNPMEERYYTGGEVEYLDQQLASNFIPPTQTQ